MNHEAQSRQSPLQMDTGESRRVRWEQALSWALYDWGNSAFATAVMAGFVPVLNKTCWNVGEPATVSTFRLTVTISVASLVGAVLAPMLGAIADRGGARKRMLLTFACLGILMTIALSLVGPGQWLWGLLAYGFALAGFSGANIFYDAMLVQICPKRKLEVISALGYALGYIGGGLLFAFNLFMVLHPAAFGFSGEQEAMRWGFVAVAIWWGLFTVPLLLWVPEVQQGKKTPLGWMVIIRQGFSDLCQTAKELRA